MPGSNARKTLLSIGVALVLGGQPLSAQAACCGPIVDAIDDAACSIRKQILEMEKALVKVISDVGVRTNAAISDQATAQKEMVDGLAEVLVEQMHRQSSYDARADVVNAYANAPRTICVDATAASRTPDGGRVREEKAKERKEQISDWLRGDGSEGSRRSDKIVAGAQMEPEDLDLEAFLMDPSGAADPEKKADLVNRLVDFTPPDPLPDDMLETTAGAVYQSRLNERRMRLEAVSSVIEDRASRTDPAYNLGDWATQMLEETGMDQTEEGQRALAALGDGLTYDMKQKLTVQARSLDSVAYQQTIELMSGGDLQRELIKQEAIGNQLAYDRLQLMQRLALLRASSEADRLKREYETDLNRIRIEAGRGRANPREMLNN